MDVLNKHIAKLIEYKGEYVGIRESRKHLAWYIKGLRGCTDIKVAINKATKFEEIDNILTHYENELK